MAALQHFHHFTLPGDRPRIYNDRGVSDDQLGYWGKSVATESKPRVAIGNLAVRGEITVCGKSLERKKADV